ncbi:IS3 family transposase [Terrisporobacter petrolearius]
MIEFVSEYIHYYNDQRIQTKLNNLSSVTYKKKAA